MDELIRVVGDAQHHQLGFVHVQGSAISEDPTKALTLMKRLREYRHKWLGHDMWNAYRTVFSESLHQGENQWFESMDETRALLNEEFGSLPADTIEKCNSVVVLHATPLYFQRAPEWTSDGIQYPPRQECPLAWFGRHRNNIKNALEWATETLTERAPLTLTFAAATRESVRAALNRAPEVLVLQAHTAQSGRVVKPILESADSYIGPFLDLEPELKHATPSLRADGSGGYIGCLVLLGCQSELVLRQLSCNWTLKVGYIICIAENVNVKVSDASFFLQHFLKALRESDVPTAFGTALQAFTSTTRFVSILGDNLRAKEVFKLAKCNQSRLAPRTELIDLDRPAPTPPAKPATAYVLRKPALPTTSECAEIAMKLSHNSAFPAIPLFKHHNEAHRYLSYAREMSPSALYHLRLPEGLGYKYHSDDEPRHMWIAWRELIAKLVSS